jgi:hypothetical protein
VVAAMAHGEAAPNHATNNTTPKRHLLATATIIVLITWTAETAYGANITIRNAKCKEFPLVRAGG